MPAKRGRTNREEVEPSLSSKMPLGTNQADFCDHQMQDKLSELVGFYMTLSWIIMEILAQALTFWYRQVSPPGQSECSAADGRVDSSHSVYIPLGPGCWHHLCGCASDRIVSHRSQIATGLSRAENIGPSLIWSVSAYFSLQVDAQLSHAACQGLGFHCHVL